MLTTFTRFWLILTACWSCYAAAQSGQFSQFEFTDADNKTRPYVVYHPSLTEGKNTSDQEKRPLIVFLHGAVSNPEVRVNPLESAQKSPLITLAEENDYYLLFPYTNKDAPWFEQKGVELVLGEIAKVIKQFPIDEDKIFLSGFSDGGSGTLYFAGNHASSFAGFIALNGSLAVAAHLGSSPFYPQNMNGKPLYIVNTQSDLLYPARMMLPVVELLRQFHSNIAFKTPQGNHDLRYFPELKAEINSFIQQHRRTLPHTISLETADERTNHFAWLKITRLSPEQPRENWHQAYSLKLFNDKASFGIVPDISYTGQGIKVKGFSKNSTAQQMGVEVGDVIVQMEQTKLDHRYASFQYLATKKAGDPTAVTLQRGENTLVLNGKFAEGYAYEVFEKQPPSGKATAELSGDRLTIRTSRVGEVEIDFNQLGLNGKKVIIVLNGKIQTVVAEGQKRFSTQP